MQKLESQRRPLTPGEVRFARALPSGGRWLLGCLLALGVFGVSFFYWVGIAILAIFFGDALFRWGAIGWGGAFGAIGLLVLWIYIKGRRLTGYTADVYEIRARGVVSFEELKSEGAYYAFGLEDGRIVFVMGQEFDDARNFPCLDFTLADIRDNEGELTCSMVQCRGSRARPVRIIPREIKTDFRMPERLEVRFGDLEQVESILERGGAEVVPAQG